MGPPLLPLLFENGCPPPAAGLGVAGASGSPPSGELRSLYDTPMPAPSAGGRPPLPGAALRRSRGACAPVTGSAHLVAGRAQILAGDDYPVGHAGLGRLAPHLIWPWPHKLQRRRQMGSQRSVAVQRSSAQS